MNYKDKWVTGEDGRRFVFTVEMQRQLAASGLPVEPASLDALSTKQQQAGARREQATPAYSRERESQPSPLREEERATRVSGEPAPRNVTEEDDMQPETIQIDPVTGKYVGRMKWYNPLRGYGFIARGGGEDIFFHKTDAMMDPEHLVEGQWVLYDVEETSKGLEASEIEVYNVE